MRRAVALAAGVSLAAASIGSVLLLGSGGAAPPASAPPSSGPSASSPVSSPPEGVASVGPAYDPLAARAPTAGGGRRVWFARDAWWAILLLDEVTGQRIYRYDPVGRRWVDTGTLVDPRPAPLVDAVADGDRVVVVSGGPGPWPSQLVRFVSLRFDPLTQRYRIEPNMPVELTATGVRSLSIAVDPSDRTWVATTTESTMQVKWSADGLHWSSSEPTLLPGSFGETDVARLVPTRAAVGLAWTDARNGRLWYADGMGGGSSSPGWGDAVSVAELSLASEPDLAAAGSSDLGAVLATSTTGEPRDPGVVVLASRPDGTWRQAVFSLVRDRHGSPVVAIDAADARIVVAAPSPARGGTIFYKTSPLADLRFPADAGVPLIQHPAGPTVADPVLSAGTISGGTHVVALASDRSVGRYLTGWLDLESVSRPSAPPLEAAPSPEPVPQALVDDRFGGWVEGDPFPVTWAVTGAPTDSPAALVASPDGTIARLSAVGPDPVRACRPFGQLEGGPLQVHLVARIVERPTSDAPVLTVRSTGSTALDVRFGSDGSFAYYNGATKVRTGVSFDAGSWYAFDAVTREDGRSDLTIRSGAADGAVTLRAAGVAPRDPIEGPMTRVCSQTPAGPPSSAVEIRSLEIGAIAP